MAELTLADVKQYLSVDFDDDDVQISQLMLVADEYLQSAIGKTYNKESERAKMLSLIVISDLYDNRDLYDKSNNKVSGTVRKLVNDFALQLKLESGGADATL